MFTYCISCSNPILPTDLNYHAVEYYREGENWVDDCFGPLTYCPPPELTEEVWDLIFQEETLI